MPVPPVRLLSLLACAAPACAQLSWSLAPATAPSPRSFATAATIAGTGNVVLFGGRDAAGVRADTWRCDASGWSLVPTVATPPARERAAMDGAAFPVLFGGRDGSGAHLGDTWKFVDDAGGGTWVPWLVPSPPPREGSAICTSPGFAAEHVLFGGRDGGQVFGDTWTLDSVGWTQQVLATAPPARHGHALAARNFGGQRQAILFGGRDAQGNLLDDTWVLAIVTTNGAPVWTQFAPTTRPSPRAGHAMRCDLLRDRVQLFGGRDNGGDLGDVWEWDGAEWRANGVLGPAAREGVAFATAPAQFAGLPVAGLLCGGQSGGAPLGDAWTLTSVAPPAKVAFGPLPTLQFSVSAMPATAGVPWLGDTIGLQLGTPIGSLLLPHVIVGFSNTTSALGPLPRDLGPMFDHQTLLVAPDQLYAMPATSPFSVLFAQVPSLPALAGVHVYLQGIGYTPGISGGRWAVSIAYDCTFGLR